MYRITLRFMALLLMAGCNRADKVQSTGMDEKVIMAQALQLRADSIGRATAFDNDFASVVRIMVVDTDGNVVVSSQREDYSSLGLTTNNDRFLFEPGRLLFPLLMSTITDLDTTIQLPVGTVNFGGYYLSDSRRILDTSTGYFFDSLPVMKALAEGSNVAMAAFGKMFFYENRDDMLQKISKILPNAIVSETTDDASFYRFCIGHGLKTNMSSLLMCYLRNDVLSLLPENGLSALYRINSRVINLFIKRYGDYVGLIIVDDCRTSGRMAQDALDIVFEL